ncbi:hypothetical protein PINS_up011574 [Pythium insidiosum]|nr:hypothetical protein PINS_up011574 [Pythium insidiosum]
MTMENDPSPSSHNGSSSSSSSRHARAADAQAHDGSQRSSRPSSGSKGRKRGFLENSNLTDQDRRQVRWKERELYQDIRENASELATLNSQRFQATTDELEEMYEDGVLPSRSQSRRVQSRRTQHGGGQAVAVARRQRSHQGNAIVQLS